MKTCDRIFENKDKHLMMQPTIMTNSHTKQVTIQRKGGKVGGTYHSRREVICVALVSLREPEDIPGGETNGEGGLIYSAFIPLVHASFALQRHLMRQGGPRVLCQRLCFWLGGVGWVVGWSKRVGSFSAGDV